MKMANDTLVLNFPNTDNLVDSQEKPETEPSVLENPKGLDGSEPDAEVSLQSMDIMTQEVAVEEFLAGELKSEFNDEVLMSNMEENEGIPFKSENALVSDEERAIEEEEEEETQVKQEKEQEEEDPQSLNKMQIMEDVREGCNVQPSSPGHAELRDKELKENGFNQEVKEEIKEEKTESEGEPEHQVHEEYSNSSSPSESSKRKCDNEETIPKRLKPDILENFNSRDKILSDFLDMTDCTNIEQIHNNSEQLLSEIRALNEMAKVKEREWNSIIHVKKLKEELLLRMQRKKQILLLNEKDYTDILESQNSILKSNLTKPRSLLKSRNLLPKVQVESNGVDLRQGRQRPVRDVQSIIADHRQKHPEAVPRRGRRIRNSQGDKVINFSSATLGSGAQVRQNSGAESGDLGVLLSSLQRSHSEALPQDTTFKDMLVQFAKLSQTERNELIQNVNKPPPPYPEVTVHPVPTAASTPTNSLLHGILTKTPTKQNSKTSFSPTLARLLTAPERHANNHSTPQMGNNSSLNPNMSISEILSSSKARNEITITPVSQYDSLKARNEEDEAEDSADRLVIDESNEASDARRGDNGSDAGDEIPQCQGCNQKPAQFVCAGCGNQWYCSRDCQVSAWDEHSEICSG